MALEAIQACGIGVARAILKPVRDSSGCRPMYERSAERAGRRARFATTGP